MHEKKLRRVGAYMRDHPACRLAGWVISDAHLLCAVTVGVMLKVPDKWLWPEACICTG